jgi:two-component system response regulator
VTWYTAPVGSVYRTQKQAIMCATGNGDVMADHTTSILLAEDNADDEMLTLRALRKAGISRVVVGRNGQEALSLLLGSGGVHAPALPDLVLLDLRMPKVGGIEVLVRLRADERTAHLPVVILTSSEDPKDCVRCKELGVVAILSKPLTVDSLNRILAALPGISLPREGISLPPLSVNPDHQ